MVNSVDEEMKEVDYPVKIALFAIGMMVTTFSAGAYVGFRHGFTTGYSQAEQKYVSKPADYHVPATLNDKQLFPQESSIEDALASGKSESKPQKVEFKLESSIEDALKKSQ